MADKLKLDGVNPTIKQNPNNITTDNTGENKGKENLDFSQQVNKYLGDTGDDYNLPYLEKRTIVISLVHNYSLYRKVNMKVFGQRKETIGSSISSCRILSSNKGEVEAYFPEIIGISPNHPDFVTRVKAWLSNIQFIVNEEDKELDTSFLWNKKLDYVRFKKREEEIDEEFEKTNRANLSALKQAVKLKVERINALESEKYLYGRPQNLEQYLMYRHCLLYKDVAKDVAFINSDASLRFYIKDSAKEAEKLRKLTEEKVKAMRNFIELNTTTDKFNSVFIAIVTSRNENVANALLKTHDEKTRYMIDYINTYPDKFNKFFYDKNVITKAFIETLIVRGELIRAEFNQQISTPDGTFIGSNMNDAVAYFNNPANVALKTAFENKIKLF